jgi:hypothetical protein
MKHRSFARHLALATALTALAGCAAAPASPEDTATSSEASELSTSGIGTVPPVVTFDPTTLCSPIPADSTVALPAPHTEKITGGTANLSRSCDYWVTEVDGTSGESFFIALGDVMPTSPQQSPIGEPRRWASTQSDCEQSYVAYDVMAYTPAHLVPSGPYGVTLVPGAWTTMQTKTGFGTYFSSYGGQCEIAAASGPIYSQYGQSYSMVRVAAAEVVQTPTGPRSQTLYLYVGH